MSDISKTPNLIVEFFNLYVQFYVPLKGEKIKDSISVFERRNLVKMENLGRFDVIVIGVDVVWSSAIKQLNDIKELYLSRNSTSYTTMDHLTMNLEQSEQLTLNLTIL